MPYSAHLLVLRPGWRHSPSPISWPRTRTPSRAHLAVHTLMWPHSHSRPLASEEKESTPPMGTHAGHMGTELSQSRQEATGDENTTNHSHEPSGTRSCLCPTPASWPWHQDSLVGAPCPWSWGKRSLRFVSVQTREKVYMFMRVYLVFTTSSSNNSRDILLHFLKAKEQPHVKQATIYVKRENTHIYPYCM